MACQHSNGHFVLPDHPRLYLKVGDFATSPLQACTGTTSFPYKHLPCNKACSSTSVHVAPCPVPCLITCRRGRPLRARRHPSTPPSTVAGGGARLRYRVRDCGSRARTLWLVATPGAPAEPPVRPSTQGMLTISRPPPRRCSAACLLGSAARRLCIFFAYRWLPCDHGPCCTLAPCFV